MWRASAFGLLLVIVAGCSTDVRSKGTHYLRVGDTSRARGRYPIALALYEKGIKTDPLNGDLYRRAAETAATLQKWTTAVAYFQRAISLRPDLLEPYAEVASIYILAHGATPPMQQAAIMRELQAVSDEIHKRFPDTFDDLRVAGYIDLLSGRSDAALARFLRARELKPEDQETLTRCVELLASAGQIERAEALAALAKTNDAAVPKMYQAIASFYLGAKRTADLDRIAQDEVNRHPDLADGYVLLAARQFSSQQWPNMLATLGRVASLNELGPFVAGDFFLRIGDLARARQQYEAGAAVSGKFQPAYQKRLVEVLSKQGQVAQAEQVVRALLKANSKDDEALAIQASLTLLKGDAKAAASQFQLVINNLPKDYVLRFLYGRARLSTGDVSSAVQQFVNAIKLRDDYVWPRIALGHISVDAGKYSDTLVLASGLVREDCLNVPFDTAGQRPEERPFYERVLNIRPTGGAPMSHLAAKMADAGIGLKQAVVMAESARQTLPANDEVAANLAAVYTRLNRLDAAMALIKPIVDRNPDRTIFHYRLAQVLLQKGEKAAADKECEAALRAQGSDEEKKRAVQLMQKAG